MSTDQALALVSNMLQVALIVAGPVLLAALVAGLIVGVIQTATQINEGSIAFVVKTAAILLTLVVAGPSTMEKAVRYARSNFEAVATVVTQ